MDIVLKIVLLLLIPSVFGFMTGINLFPDKKKAAIFSFIAAVFSGLLSGVLKLLIWKHWTIYEMLLSATLLSLAGLCIYQIIRDKKKFTCDFALRVLCFASIAVTFFYIATYGQANLNSDNGMITRLAKSRAENLTLFPQTWYYANGDIGQWLSSITCNAPFVLLMNNQSMARVLGSILFIIVILITVCIVVKKVFRSKSWIVIIPLTILFVTGQCDVTHIETAYIGGLMASCLNVALVYLAVFLEKKKCIIFSVMYFFVKSIGGIRFISDWTIPLACSVLLLIYSINRKKTESADITSKKISLCILVVILPSVLGFFAYRWLCTWNNVNNTINNAMMFVDSVPTCIGNFWKYISNFFTCFGFIGGANFLSIEGIKNLVSIVICVLICFIVPILQGIKLKNENSGIKFLYFFAVFHIFIRMIMNTCATLGDYDSRYVLSSVYLCIIISSRYIYEYWLKKIVLDKRVLTSLFYIASAIECVFLLSFTPGWTNALAEKKDLNSFLADKGLTKGYATYWNAYNNEIYSDNRIRYGGVKLTARWVRKDLWLVDAAVYNETPGGSFLLLTEAEDEYYNERVLQIFGEPEEKINYTSYQVYIYDYDIGPKLKEPYIYQSDEFFLNGNAEYGEDSIIINEGGGVFGPYERINLGKYIIRIKGENLDQCSYDVFSYSNPASVAFTEQSRSSEEIIVEASIGAYLNDVEFRINNIGQGIVRLDRVEVNTK